MNNDKICTFYYSREVEFKYHLMKRTVIGIIVAAVIIGGLIFAQKNFSREREPAPRPEAQGAEHVIVKTDAGFSPANITIKFGDKVRFKNDGTKDMRPASNIHPTHTIYPEFDALRGFAPGQSYSFTFAKAGEWPYHDHLDPTAGGIIIVEP